MSSVALAGIPGGPEPLVFLPILALIFGAIGVYWYFNRGAEEEESDDVELDKTADPYLQEEIEENVDDSE